MAVRLVPPDTHSLEDSLSKMKVREVSDLMEMKGVRQKPWREAGGREVTCCPGGTVTGQHAAVHVHVHVHVCREDDLGRHICKAKAAVPVNNRGYTF